MDVRGISTPAHTRLIVEMWFSLVLHARVMWKLISTITKRRILIFVELLRRIPPKFRHEILHEILSVELILPHLEKFAKT